MRLRVRRAFLFVLMVVLVAGCGQGAAALPDSAPSRLQTAPAATGAPLAIPSATPTAAATVVVPRPVVGQAERWIEVDLAAQTVRLRQGESIMSQHLAATGVATATETVTAPGLYQVQQMIEGPIENVPGVWVADILIYDYFGGIGIHSMPMDADGRVLDDTLGRPASGGCVRVGDSHAVYKFGRLGMVVWVH